MFFAAVSINALNVLGNYFGDVWRLNNVASFKFTWGTQNPTKRARLDYFKTSHAFANIVSECSTVSKYRSDHNLVRRMNIQ